MPNICLNMIVKNESANIEALFNAVRDFVDYYVIVDTGSTDGTVQKIKEYTEGWLPGEVHEREWVGFSTNRNQALDLARASGSKWAFVIDADDNLIMPNKKPKMVDEVTYFIPKRLGQMQWEVPNVMWLGDDWRWEYEIHEVAMCSRFRRETIGDALVDCNTRKGHRSEGNNKIQQDIEILKKAVTKEPKDSRSWFYLATSYATIGDAASALDAYGKRIALGGWHEELCMSHFMTGRIKYLTNQSPGEAIKDFLTAHRNSPERAEPLAAIANIYRTKLNNPEAAYPYARLASGKKIDKDFLFADVNIFTYGSLHEYMLACHSTGRKKECLDCCDRLRKVMPSIPEADRILVEKDIKEVLL